MKTILFLILFLPTFLSSQTVLIDEDFTPPTSSGWSTTPSGWMLNNYGAANALSGNWALRLTSWSASSPKYAYFPVTVQPNKNYVITFWTKRICSLTVNVNETANQTTLIESNLSTNPDCSSNWTNWNQWTDVYTSNYTGTVYFQILVNSTYFSTTLYIEDVRIIEMDPTALPIELLYFKGKNVDDYNNLYWSTASEHNNDYFTLEKSYDGYVFHVVDKIDGAGNSTHQLYYEFHDYNLQPLITYYRLKQTDYDGKYEYSEIISIDNRSNNNDKPKLTNIVNTLGQTVNVDYNGLLIYRYSDGSVKKVNNQH
jgi:hypothetical protein